MGDAISTIMHQGALVSVSDDETISHCVSIMRDKRIGALVVKNNQGDVIGTISERDITRKVVAEARDAKTTKAADIVYTDVTILDKSEPIEKAMEAIINTKRRHVLIEDEGQVVSIISIGDLMKQVLMEKNQMIEHLENYIRS